MLMMQLNHDCVYRMFLQIAMSWLNAFSFSEKLNLSCCGMSGLVYFVGDFSMLGSWPGLCHSVFYRYRFPLQVKPKTKCSVPSMHVVYVLFMKMRE